MFSVHYSTQLRDTSPSASSLYLPATFWLAPHHLAGQLNHRCLPLLAYRPPEVNTEALQWWRTASQQIYKSQPLIMLYIIFYSSYKILFWDKLCPTVSFKFQQEAFNIFYDIKFVWKDLGQINIGTGNWWTGPGAANQVSILKFPQAYFCLGWWRFLNDGIQCPFGARYITKRAFKIVQY